MFANFNISQQKQKKSMYDNKLQKNIYKDKYNLSDDTRLEPSISSSSKNASKRSLDELSVCQQKKQKRLEPEDIAGLELSDKVRAICAAL